MYLPTLQPTVNSDSYIHGDVSIHPKAAIASGVILQASPDGQIVIEEEVCLGMGVIINAYQGVIIVRKGAILGAGVLIMGKATVGANCCVGASSTLINTNIESQSAIAPGTLLGDSSRQVELSDGEINQVEVKWEATVTPQQETKVQETPISEEQVDPVELETEFAESVKIEEDASEAEQQAFESENEILEQIGKSPVVGKMYVNQLLVTLFPQNQNFKKHKLSD